MTEKVLIGASAAPGMAAGAARVLAQPPESETELPAAERDAETRTAEAALERAAAELEVLGSRLRAEGREPEAEIVETGVLMAADPSLREAVVTAVRDHGRPAAAALVEAAEDHAAAIASVADPMLAARADDVRSLGRRAARLASGNGGPGREAAYADVVLVASDLGPADVAELGPEVRAIALAHGGVTAHAAIVARSLGLPMVTGLGEDVLRAPSGTELVVDGNDGSVIVSPEPDRFELALSDAKDREHARRHAIAMSAVPAVTRDGHRVVVHTNAATPVEVAVGLEAGAEGAGLIRTELAFLDAAGWPTEEQHLRQLAPLLRPLRGLPATVRVLDFGGDKTPPFLSDTSLRGIELLLAAPEALAAQLRAAVLAGADSQLRILLPMVRSPEDVDATRDVLRAVLAELPDSPRPQLGAMIELPAAAEASDLIAPGVDFLSIGTNDLTHAALGADRLAAGEAPTHHPVVLRLIAMVVRAAREARVPVEVCGESASDPLTAPLLVGMGVNELSVGAARVGLVRSWIRSLNCERAESLGRAALRATSAAEVEGLVRPIARTLESLDERGDAAGQGLDGGRGVLPAAPKA